MCVLERERTQRMRARPIGRSDRNLALVHVGLSDSRNPVRGVRVRPIATPIAILLPLGFALTLTTYVTVADSSMLEPSYLLEGRFALGVAMTYQYDGSKGTTLALDSWSTRDDHYELGAFRFLTPQTRLGCAQRLRPL
jgi:hypothetical protein